MNSNTKNRSYEEKLIDQLCEITKENFVWKHDVLSNLKKLLDVVQLLESEQKSFEPSFPTCENLERFSQWFEKISIGGQFFKVAYIGNLEGYGLIATKDILEDELIMQIPKKYMISTDNVTFQNSFPYLVKDPLLQAFPSTLLALSLLHEKFIPNSKFLPYITILPSTFSIPLFYNFEEFQLLTGSNALNTSIRCLYNVVKQYVYLYTSLKRYGNRFQHLPFELEFFTFAHFRWATAIVMTRQNQIPSHQGFAFALIPGWDLCNHNVGRLTTFYNGECESLECFAMKSFRANEEIRIFYGCRTNQELFVYSGFVVKDNCYDVLMIEVSSKDELLPIKKMLIQKQKLLPTTVHPIHNNLIVSVQLNSDGSIDPLVLSWLRILYMDKEQLTLTLRRFSSNEALDKEFIHPLHEIQEKELYNQLIQSCKTRLDAYPSYEENTFPIENKDDSLKAVALTLCQEEKKILQKAIQFLKMSY